MKNKKWLAVGIVGIVIIIVVVGLLGLNAFKLSSVSNQDLLAESSATSASSQKAKGDIADFQVNLSLLEAGSTLVPAASCVSADYLKSYPSAPKKWAEQTKCGQAYMKNTIYQQQRDLAQGGVQWLADNIIMVRKSLREILPLTDIKDLPSGGMIPTGEIENLPLEGATLSMQCIKDKFGQQAAPAAWLAGEYREDFAKAAAYVPFSEATLKKLTKAFADGEVSLIEGLALSPRYTLITNNSFADRSEPGLFQPASISRNESEDMKIPLTGGTLCKGYDIDTPLGSDTVCLPFDPLGSIKSQTKDRLETMTLMQNSLRNQVASSQRAITALKKSNPSCFGLSKEK